MTWPKSSVWLLYTAHSPAVSDYSGRVKNTCHLVISARMLSQDVVTKDSADVEQTAFVRHFQL